MSTQRGIPPFITSPILWVFVVLTAAAGVVLHGLSSGAGLFIGGATGVVLLAVLVRLVDQFRGPDYDNKIDPWDD